MKKNYTLRPNVKRYLSVWKRYVLANGEEQAFNMLHKGRTTHLSHKDQKGLIQILGLEKYYTQK